MGSKKVISIFSHCVLPAVIINICHGLLPNSQKGMTNPHPKAVSAFPSQGGNVRSLFALTKEALKTTM